MNTKLNVIYNSLFKYFKKIRKINFRNFKSEIHVIFVVLILTFVVFIRIIPPFFIGFLFAIIAISFLILDVFYYFEIIYKTKKQTHQKITEYSWGLVKELHFEMDDIKNIFNFVIKQPASEYLNYLKSRIIPIIFILFIFGDVLVAFKNLDLKIFGIYIAMSIFSKGVFIGFYYFNKKLKEIEINDDELVLDIFYNFLNLFLTCSILTFVFIFLSSKIFIEIFFGQNYFPFHTSLPYVFLGNIALCLALTIYYTAKKINSIDTNKILKVYGILISLTFVFINNPSLDSVTYFVIGSSLILSIFLYNLVIKKPAYIKSTYNHLF